MSVLSHLSNCGQPMAGRGGAAHCQALAAPSPAFLRLRVCAAPGCPAAATAPSRRPGMGAGTGTMSVLGSPVRAYDFLLKFLLVGDSDVGKGEILESLQDGAAESPYGHPAGERGPGSGAGSAGPGAGAWAREGAHRGRGGAELGRGRGVGPTLRGRSGRTRFRTWGPQVAWGGRGGASCVFSARSARPRERVAGQARASRPRGGGDVGATPPGAGARPPQRGPRARRTREECVGERARRERGRARDPSPPAQAPGGCSARGTRGRRARDDAGGLACRRLQVPAWPRLLGQVDRPGGQGAEWPWSVRPGRGRRGGAVQVEAAAGQGLPKMTGWTAATPRRVDSGEEGGGARGRREGAGSGRYLPREGCWPLRRPGGAAPLLRGPWSSEPAAAPGSRGGQPREEGPVFFNFKIHLALSSDP